MSETGSGVGQPERPVETTANAPKNARQRAAQRRKERMERRHAALRNACEGLLVARGFSIREAAEFAYWWVRQAWQAARRVMERMGFDYMSGTWGMT